LWGVVIGVIGTVGSMAYPNPAVALWLGGVFAVVVVPSVLLWLYLAIQPIWRNALRGIDQAATPLPSPAAVAEAFRAEYGRSPSAAEIQVIYTYLQDQQRLRLLMTGARCTSYFLALDFTLQWWS